MYIYIYAFVCQFWFTHIHMSNCMSAHISKYASGQMWERKGKCPNMCRDYSGFMSEWGISTCQHICQDVYTKGVMLPRSSRRIGWNNMEQWLIIQSWMEKAVVSGDFPKKEPLIIPIWPRLVPGIFIQVMAVSLNIQGLQWLNLSQPEGFWHLFYFPKTSNQSRPACFPKMIWTHWLKYRSK